MLKKDRKRPLIKGHRKLRQSLRDFLGPGLLEVKSKTQGISEMFLKDALNLRQLVRQ